MSEIEKNIFGIVEKIKTPLALAGLALIIMYLILNAILKLDIFVKVGSEDTFIIVNKIINYVFIIALLTLVLGLIAFSISKFRKKKPKLGLIDASFDDEIKQKVANCFQGEFELEKEVYCGNNFLEAIDFKFINTGDGTAFIKDVSIEILESKINYSSMLSVKYKIQNGNILISVTNLGWGKTTINDCIIRNPLLDNYKITNYKDMLIESGESKVIAEIKPTPINEEYYEELIGKIAERKEILYSIYSFMKKKDMKIFEIPNFNLLLSTHERWHVEEFFEDINDKDSNARQQWHIDYFKSELEHGLPINQDVIIEIDYTDLSNKQYKEEFDVQLPSQTGGYLWWTPEDFIFKTRDLRFRLMPPRDIYSIILSPDKSNYIKTYPLSHYLKSQDVERFHFVLVSEKSADYKLRFVFSFNKNKKVASKIIYISLLTENKPDNFKNIIDGKHLKMVDEKIQLN